MRNFSDSLIFLCVLAAKNERERERNKDKMRDEEKGQGKKNGNFVLKRNRAKQGKALLWLLPSTKKAKKTVMRIVGERRGR